MRVPTHSESRVLARADASQHQTPTLSVEGPLSPRGTITLISGCMFSGKTTELLRRISRHSPSRTLAVKHVSDTRYSASQIVSHAGQAYPATLIAEAQEMAGHLPHQAEIVAIDEAHFFDESLTGVTLDLAGRGIDVVLTSLEPDSWGRPFAIGEQLRAVADEPITLYATCARCGATADRTQRLTAIIDGHMVGGPESSEPRCRNCWFPPPEPHRA